jgi:hypothetical protein
MQSCQELFYKLSRFGMMSISSFVGTEYTHFSARGMHFSAVFVKMMTSSGETYEASLQWSCLLGINPRLIAGAIVIKN